MDQSWQVRSEAWVNIQKPPTTYLNKFYYDYLTHSESALRMLIDTVGVKQVVFGTDWSAEMAIDWPVSWILSLESLTEAEKEAILSKNMEKLLGLYGIGWAVPAGTGAKGYFKNPAAGVESFDKSRLGATRGLQLELRLSGLAPETDS